MQSDNMQPDDMQPDDMQLDNMQPRMSPKRRPEDEDYVPAKKAKTTRPSSSQPAQSVPRQTRSQRKAEDIFLGDAIADGDATNSEPGDVDDDTDRNGDQIWDILEGGAREPLLLGVQASERLTLRFRNQVTGETRSYNYMDTPGAIRDIDWNDKAHVADVQKWRNRIFYRLNFPLLRITNRWSNEEVEFLTLVRQKFVLAVEANKAISLPTSRQIFTLYSEEFGGLRNRNAFHNRWYCNDGSRLAALKGRLDDETDLKPTGGPEYQLTIAPGELEAYIEHGHASIDFDDAEFKNSAVYKRSLKLAAKRMAAASKKAKAVEEEAAGQDGSDPETKPTESKPPKKKPAKSGPKKSEPKKKPAVKEKPAVKRKKSNASDKSYTGEQPTKRAKRSTRSNSAPDSPDIVTDPYFLGPLKRVVVEAPRESNVRNMPPYADAATQTEPEDTVLKAPKPTPAPSKIATSQPPSKPTVSPITPVHPTIEHSQLPFSSTPSPSSPTPSPITLVYPTIEDSQFPSASTPSAGRPISPPPTTSRTVNPSRRQSAPGLSSTTPTSPITEASRSSSAPPNLAATPPPASTTPTFPPLLLSATTDPSRRQSVPTPSSPLTPSPPRRSSAPSPSSPAQSNWFLAATTNLHNRFANPALPLASTSSERCFYRVAWSEDRIDVFPTRKEGAAGANALLNAAIVPPVGYYGDVNALLDGTRGRDYGLAQGVTEEEMAVYEASREAWRGMLGKHDEEWDALTGLGGEEMLDGDDEIWEEDDILKEADIWENDDIWEDDEMILY